YPAAVGLNFECEQMKSRLASTLESWRISFTAISKSEVKGFKAASHEICIMKRRAMSFASDSPYDALIGKKPILSRRRCEINRRVSGQVIRKIPPGFSARKIS